MLRAAVELAPLPAGCAELLVSVVAASIEAKRWVLSTTVHGGELIPNPEFLRHAV